MNHSAVIDRTITGLQSRNYLAHHVATADAALEAIKALIPAGASVMNGSSVTLQDIGFIDYLKAGQHGWQNLHADIVAAPDESTKAVLRQQALHAAWYVGSVHALTEDGQMLIASNTGSQLPHLAFTSPNIILVVGSQKIVPDMAAAWQRLEQVVVPKENERAMAAWGSPTTHAKTLVLHRENPRLGRKIHVVIVDTPLGF